MSYIEEIMETLSSRSFTCFTDGERRVIGIKNLNLLDIEVFKDHTRYFLNAKYVDSLDTALELCRSKPVKGVL